MSAPAHILNRMPYLQSVGMPAPYPSFSLNGAGVTAVADNVLRKALERPTFRQAFELPHAPGQPPRLAILRDPAAGDKPDNVVTPAEYLAGAVAPAAVTRRPSSSDATRKPPQPPAPRVARAAAGSIDKVAIAVVKVGPEPSLPADDDAAFAAELDGELAIPDLPEYSKNSKRAELFEAAAARGLDPSTDATRAQLLELLERFEASREEAAARN